MKFTRNGIYNLNLKTTDDCGNETRGTRQVVIVQNLLAGRYIEIAESGDTATISADVSADYYDKVQINQMFADLDTVKFRKVTSLPTRGAANIIYLVPKEAPDVGYDQYIWNEIGNVYEPIGDTDIDLDEYYTKIESDARYYTKTESDDKFQEKLTLDTPITTVGDNTEVSNVNPVTKLIHNIKASDFWTYIKGKFNGSAISSVTDTVRISGINTSDTNIHSYFSALDLWNYVVDKLGAQRMDFIGDDTRISGINTSETIPHKYFKASVLFAYVMEKIGVTISSTMTDDTYLSNFSPSSASQVTRVKGSTIWSWILTKLTTTIGTASTNQQVPSNKAVYDYVEARRRYLHILSRQNNDALQYPMGWCAIITENATETYASIAKWLYDNQYRSSETSYYWVGGCCGTTGVRNQQDTGTTYIGRVTSGAFSADGTTITFKYDYNGTVSFQSNRSVVHSHPLMKLTT